VRVGITMRDPTAETASALRPRAKPLDTFVGKTIALMDIGKMRGNEFIDRLERLCRERGVATRRFKKPTNTRVAPRELVMEIAESCHAVIIALSDCGSCTSCSTHDLNELDKRGLVGVNVLTEEFRPPSRNRSMPSDSTQHRSLCLIPCRTGRRLSCMHLPMPALMRS
jgi:hypothetical protein